MSNNNLIFSGKTLAIFIVFALAFTGAYSCRQAPGVDATISNVDLLARIQKGNAPLILDVRTSEEYQSGHIPGSVNIPHSQLSSRLSELGISKSNEVVVHCEIGRRASTAEMILTESGYTQVLDLEGHMRSWRESKLPTE